MTTLSQKAFDANRNGTPLTVSFEAFPARNCEDLQRLGDLAHVLEGYSPKFLSVTYGAGGTTRVTTLNSVERIAERTDHKIAGHLTCVGQSRDETNQVIDDYRRLGVERIVALRGDAPAGAAHYEAHPDGYQATADLVKHLKTQHNFDVSVAAYPEKHPDSSSRKDDLDNLKAKIDAGADRAITQFFFDNDLYYEFADKAAAHGINKDIVPGILLIHDFAKVSAFAGRCHASIPEWLKRRFSGLENDLEAQKLAATGVAAEQVLDLAAQGVKHFHFYTLNRPELAIAMCRCLGIAPHYQLAEAA